MVHGVRTREQLLAEGIPATTINDRLRRGVYTRLLPRTYCLGTPTTLARCAAVTAWIPAAMLSHRTSAWLHNMLPTPEIIEATVPPTVHRRTPPWLVLYRRDLPTDVSDEAWGLPTVNAAQTLLDCVHVMPKSGADRLADEHLTRSIDPHAASALAHSGKRGAPALRRQLREAAVHAASDAERLFSRALAERGLRMLANHPVGPYRCDFVDQASQTIVEIDGYEFHSTPAIFRSDRRRQNWLVRRGWLVLRYAAADIYTTIDTCADEVVTVVRTRRR